MENLLDKHSIQKFKKDGFLTLNDIFTNKEMDQFESAITSLYLMQANKIEDYKKKIDQIMNKKIIVGLSWSYLSLM